ncbi:hypothetical protein [Streptomyces sp. Y2F8-2]|uniref:hypothetical protein n=1 Tax=Streptomyces sp. Y2F8-2 TaxID=2759675 RepID=UPI0019057134|nr:hypothetical protein [Streptomyces sp. Y2F8-2]
MAEAVQDGGERGVQDGADRLEAVTASASSRSASTIASASDADAVAEPSGGVETGAGDPPGGEPGAVTPYAPQRVHRPGWLPSRAPTGQVIGCVVPSGSAQTSPA